ncbi:unnamed protein product [Caenorhabditis angaria]|uniref:Seven TM Receptor n=1 Tax=Caenorhabditis angaria TaxID=860376 RepID=A0A9P1J069_9PELO|nr:unnamed protein product [Caenorhabditis angaria]
MNFLNCIYCGCVGASLGFYSIQFFYRYLVSNNLSSMNYSQNNKTTIIFLIPLLFGTMWTLCPYFLAPMSEAKSNYVREDMLDQLGIDVLHTIYVGFFFYPKDRNGNRFLHINSLIVNILESSSLTASLFSIFYYGYQCYKNMNENLAMSISHRNLQKQLFLALVIQTSVPIILLHFPVAIAYILVVLEKALGPWSGFLTITIALYPAVDPLPNILIIKSYRNAIKEFICKFIHVGKSAQVADVSREVTRVTS